MHTDSAAHASKRDEDDDIDRFARDVCHAYDEFCTYRDDTMKLFILHTAYRVEMESRSLSVPSFEIKQLLFTYLVACAANGFTPAPAIPLSTQQNDELQRRFNANAGLVEKHGHTDFYIRPSAASVFADLDAETKMEIVNLAPTLYNLAYKNSGHPRIPPPLFNGS